MTILHETTLCKHLKISDLYEGNQGGVTPQPLTNQRKPRNKIGAIESEVTMASSPFPTPYPDKQTSTLVASKTSSVPWYIWWGALAVTSASIGGAWDVSWHRSIGRDTFWTAAHMAIYACGVLAGIICCWLIAQCTFGHDSELSSASVNVFGLRAPLGIFVTGWGCVAVLTSGQ